MGGKRCDERLQLSDSGDELMWQWAGQGTWRASGSDTSKLDCRAAFRDRPPIALLKEVEALSCCSGVEGASAQNSPSVR